MAECYHWLLLPISCHFQDCKSASGHECDSCKQRSSKHLTFTFVQSCADRLLSSSIEKKKCTILAHGMQVSENAKIFAFPFGLQFYFHLLFGSGEPDIPPGHGRTWSAVHTDNTNKQTTSFTLTFPLYF